MLKWTRTVTMFFLCIFTLAAYAEAPSPVGLWKTIDDVTGKPKAIVQLSLSGNQILSGRILKIYPRPGHDQNELCSACEGALHNQRIVGMVILHHLKRDSNNAKLWSGGTILDPKNGKHYHCYATLSDNGQQLFVRGYIGVPLFGRSQTWHRVSRLD